MARCLPPAPLTHTQFPDPATYSMCSECPSSECRSKAQPRSKQAKHGEKHGKTWSTLRPFASVRRQRAVEHRACCSNHAAQTIRRHGTLSYLVCLSAVDLVANHRGHLGGDTRLAHQCKNQHDQNKSRNMKSLSSPRFAAVTLMTRRVRTTTKVSGRVSTGAQGFIVAEITQASTRTDSKMRYVLSEHT